LEAKRAGEQEKLNDFLKFNLYRLFLLTIFLLLSYYMGQTIYTIDTTLIKSISTFLILSFTVTIVVVLLSTWEKIPLNYIIHFQFSIDTVLTLFLIYSTGAGDSPLTFLLLLLALSISFFFPSWVNIFYGVAEGIGFTLLTYYYQFQNGLPVTPEITMKIFYIFSAILIFVLLGSFLTSRLTKMEKKIETQEKSLTEFRELYQTIVNNVGSGILITDTGGKILFANPSAMKILGENPAGKNIKTIFGTIPSPTLFREELQINYEDKNLVIGLSASEINIGGEKHILITFQDLTRIKEVEKKLIEKEKFALIGEMASNIAHDLRNPLSAVKLSVELLLEELNKKEPDDAKINRFASVLTEESERIEHLIKQILNYSREIQIKEEKIDLREFLKETFKKTSNENNAQTELEITGENTVINGDRFWLQEAFINLFQNSIEAMNRRGKIIVHVEKKDNSINLKISDTGEGIPDQYAEKIFQPFFTTKQKGTGLGLPLVKKIITAHRGTIYWDRRDKCFVVKIPEGEKYEKDAYSGR